MNRQSGSTRRRNRTTVSDLHPLAAPFPPLQRVGLFAASSVRALAGFAALNAAARECVTQMGVRDRALPRALQADVARRADRAAVKCAWECKALADALVPNAQQLGIDAVQVELLIAFRDVGNLPVSWSLATPLEEWAGVNLFLLPLKEWDAVAMDSVHPEQGSVTAISLVNRYLTGAVDLTQLPASLVTLDLSQNQLTGAVDLTQLPASLAGISLGFNKLTGTIDLTKLPATLRQVWLYANQLMTRQPADGSRPPLTAAAGDEGPEPRPKHAVGLSRPDEAPGVADETPRGLQPADGSRRPHPPSGVAHGVVAGRLQAGGHLGPHQTPGVADETHPAAEPTDRHRRPDEAPGVDE